MGRSGQRFRLFDRSLLQALSTSPSALRRACSRAAPSRRGGARSRADSLVALLIGKTPGSRSGLACWQVPGRVAVVGPRRRARTPSVTPVTAAPAISTEFPRNADDSLTTSRIAEANV